MDNLGDCVEELERSGFDGSDDYVGLPSEPVIIEEPEVETDPPLPTEPYIVVRNMNSTDGTITVRTNMGDNAARRLAEFEMGKPVHISLVLEPIASRLELIVEMAKARKEGRRYVPPPLCRDYVFLTRGKRCMLPDIDHSLNLRAMKQSGKAMYQQKKQRRLKSLIEHLREVEEGGGSIESELANVSVNNHDE